MHGMIQKCGKSELKWFNFINHLLYSNFIVKKAYDKKDQWNLCFWLATVTFKIQSFGGSRREGREAYRAPWPWPFTIQNPLYPVSRVEEAIRICWWPNG